MLPASLTWEPPPPPPFTLLPGPELVYQQCGVRLHFGDREHSRKVPHHWQRFGSTCFNSWCNQQCLVEWRGKTIASANHAFFWKQNLFAAVWLLCPPVIFNFERQQKRIRNAEGLKKIGITVRFCKLFWWWIWSIANVFVLVVRRFAN